MLQSAGQNMVWIKVWGKFKTLVKEVRMEQTVFGLPFVYAGALLAVGERLTFRQVVFITLAVGSARTFAMLANRIIDREIDRRNPRTQNRALPSKKIRILEAYFYAFISLAVYLIAAFNLSPLSRWLSPLPLFFFTFYPYTKRFTWFCHFFLGLTLGLAPLAGWIAVANGVSLVPFLLLLAVMFWVSGFDIYYAFADVEFDRKEGVFSFPACFGEKQAVFFVWLLHILAFFPLFAVGLIQKLPFLYYFGLFFAFAFLWWLDLVFSPLKRRENIDVYLQRNGYFSVIYFLFTFLSVWGFK